MNSSQFTTKAAILGDYPPRKCGIATFTRDLRDALNSKRPDWDCPVVTVTDPGTDLVGGMPGFRLTTGSSVTEIFADNV